MCYNAAKILIFAKCKENVQKKGKVVDAFSVAGEKQAYFLWECVFGIKNLCIFATKNIKPRIENVLN